MRVFPLLVFLFAGHLLSAQPPEITLTKGLIIKQSCRIKPQTYALVGCNDVLVYNNRFHFNSSLGIGLYRNSRNRLMHNFLDWNVRGYSHGVYQRGQDSAGILVYEQSH